MITQATKRPATIRALGLAVVAGLVLAMACETPGPTGPADVGSNPLNVDEVRAEMSGGDCDPVWFINGERSSIGAMDALNRGEVESVEVFHPGEGAEEWMESVPPSRHALTVVAHPQQACAIVSILTTGATPDQAAAARALVERLMTARREAAGVLSPRTQTLHEVQEAPAFTPMTVRPVVRNAEDVRASLQRYYPPLLRDAGIGGTAKVWFLIDEEGNVQRTLVNESTGYEALDMAALKVADGMEFTPAYNRDQRVPVWVSLDITFEVQGASSPASESGVEAEEAAPEGGILRRAREGETLQPAREAAAIRERQSTLRARETAAEPTRIEIPPTPEEITEGAAVSRPSTLREIQSEPVFTPMTVRPTVKNAAAMARALDDNYPPLLRDAGIGGTVKVWFFIDENGTVQRAQVNESSGYDAFDQAALEVARAMEFTPAYNRDQKVPVWISLDVTFEVQN